MRSDNYTFKETQKSGEIRFGWKEKKNVDCAVRLALVVNPSLKKTCNEKSHVDYGWSRYRLILIGCRSQVEFHLNLPHVRVDEVNHLSSGVI